MGAERFTNGALVGAGGRYRGQEGAHLEPLKVKPVGPGLPGFRLPGIWPTPAAVPSEHDVR